MKTLQKFSNTEYIIVDINFCCIWHVCTYRM